MGRNEREERAVTKRLYKPKLALVLLHSLSQADENVNVVDNVLTYCLLPLFGKSFSEELAGIQLSVHF